MTKSTHITSQTTKTIANKDLVVTTLSNGVRLVDDNKEITAYDGLDRFVFNQDGEKIRGSYKDLLQAQKISEALDVIGLII